MRLLIVEDERELAEALREAFARRQIHCELAHDTMDAELMVRTTTYLLIVLDLGLPDADGLDLLRRLRRARHSEAVLVLTARSGIDEKVTALAAGADDYLVKPFHFEELHARVQAILRRKLDLDGASLRVATLDLDPQNRELRIGGKPVELSARECELLELLMRRPDHVVPKRLLEDQLFGAGDSLGSNAVEVYIHRIRKRLEAAGAPVSVQTVRGIGYMLLTR